ncbi:hypothetical protein BIW11_00235 [Tropilaelaps mercedesae]|uniref:Uncharacterized protein n=1 Tax=Tropilaelaps mercedesae TaxID=418985 RepID=A0A1V9XZL7_9ACAR|nr:hypothetical protein BIW11_00235 [Tropilaelaps mercedesae]
MPHSDEPAEDGLRGLCRGWVRMLIGGFDVAIRDPIVPKLDPYKDSTTIEYVRGSMASQTSLYEGLPSRVAMIVTAMQWFIYDAVDVGLGLPRPVKNVG